MSKCRFLPEADRKYMAVARQITSIVNDEDNEPDDLTADDDNHYETTGALRASYLYQNGHD